MLGPAEIPAETARVARVVGTAQRRGVELLGQAHGTGSEKHHGPGAGPVRTDALTVDWDRQQVTFPDGITTDGWCPRTDSKGTEVVRVRFRHSECRACPDPRSCLGSATGQRRKIMLRHHNEHQAIREDRASRETREWRDRYQHRNGIEAADCQGVRAFGMRRSQYRNQPELTSSTCAPPPR